MKGSTVQLVEIMASDDCAKDYIQEFWKSLYDMIYMEDADWDALDEISAFAIQDMDVHGVI